MGGAVGSSGITGVGMGGALKRGVTCGRSPGRPGEAVGVGAQQPA